MFGEGSRETDILHLNLWQIAFLFPSKLASNPQINYNITVQKKGGHIQIHLQNDMIPFNWNRKAD